MDSWRVVKVASSSDISISYCFSSDSTCCGFPLIGSRTGKGGDQTTREGALLDEWNENELLLPGYPVGMSG